MCFLRARYYNPQTGRFISRDPIKGTMMDSRTQNPYIYTANNPIIYNDPSGEMVGPELWNTGANILRACGAFITNVANKSPQTIQRGTQNPKVMEAAKRGQEAHKLQQYPAGYQKEVVLESGKRVDALNEATKHVIELKPNNPAAIHKGENQLNQYLNELNTNLGPGWTGSIWTYNP